MSTKVGIGFWYFRSVVRNVLIVRAATEINGVHVNSVTAVSRSKPDREFSSIIWPRVLHCTSRNEVRTHSYSNQISKSLTNKALGKVKFFESLNFNLKYLASWKYEGWLYVSKFPELLWGSIWYSWFSTSIHFFT